MSQILVTGGRGRLARALATEGGGRVRALDRAGLDITDPAALAAVLTGLRPAAVINCAAVSNVDAAAAAHAVNAAAPGKLAQACTAVGAPFIHLSTDYVFGAATTRPWREDNPVSPVNDYGRFKAEGERGALAAGGRVCVVRVAWLFGDGEDFIARLVRGADPATPVRVAHDQIGSPTPIGPLAIRLLQLADRMATDPLPPVLHMAGTPPVSRADWVETAFDALTAAGRRPPPLIRAPLAAFVSTAPRPYFSALDCSLSQALFGSPLDWRAAASRAETFPA